MNSFTQWELILRKALTGAVAITTALLLASGISNASPRGLKALSALPRSLSARPAIVENGSDLILFPDAGLSRYYPLTPAFTPNGDAYFASFGVVTRISPDGSNTQFFLTYAGAGGQIIYAHELLWTSSFNGIIEFTPDGKSHRDYYLGAPILSLTAGNQGSVYGIAATYDSTTKVETGKLFRVGGSGGTASFSLPVHPLGPLALGQEGLPYFSYTDDRTGAFGIARVESSGSTTLFPIKGEGVGAQVSYSLVSSNGYLYFTFIGVPATGPGVNYAPELFGRLSPTGVITELPPFPRPVHSQVSTLSVDKGGNIWTVLYLNGEGTTDALYQYDVYTGQYNGPYAAPSLNSSYILGPFVGPDDNIYLFFDSYLGPTARFGAFVRHVQTLEPKALSLTAGKPNVFAILETHFNGPWTAQSLNPAIATVSPSSSATGDFSVTETGLGRTTIAVRDRLGNISYEQVASH